MENLRGHPDPASHRRHRPGETKCIRFKTFQQRSDCTVHDPAKLFRLHHINATSLSTSLPGCTNPFYESADEPYADHRSKKHYYREPDRLSLTKAERNKQANGSNFAQTKANYASSINDLVDRIFLDVFRMGKDDEFTDQPNGEDLHPEDDK